MYRGYVVDGDALVVVGTEERPVGPDFTRATLKDAVYMEVWHSSFEDHADFTEFRLYDSNRHMIAMARVYGGTS